MVDETQKIDSLRFERIYFILVFVPQFVAGGARDVLPPGIGAPPPPLPVFATAAQPPPVLHVFVVNLGMMLLQVRIYFNIELLLLLGNDLL